MRCSKANFSQCVFARSRLPALEQSMWVPCLTRTVIRPYPDPPLSSFKRLRTTYATLCIVTAALARGAARARKLSSEARCGCTHVAYGGRWVELYASDQAAFFRDFEKAYIRLANLGTPLA